MSWQLYNNSENRLLVSYEARNQNMMYGIGNQIEL